MEQTAGGWADTNLEMAWTAVAILDQYLDIKVFTRQARVKGEADGRWCRQQTSQQISTFRSPGGGGAGLGLSGSGNEAATQRHN